MIAAPNQARWVRPEPRRTMPAKLLERIVHVVFPHASILNIQTFTDGLRNANFRLELDSGQQVVLRIYEHDPSLCQKEVDLVRLIGDSVPVPEVLYAEPRGWEDTPPFTLARYIEGITFRELKRNGDAVAIAQASYSAGQVLASIARTTFSKPGWLASGSNVNRTLLDGPNPVPRFVDLCLASANLQGRMEADLRDRTHELVWSWAPQIASLDNESRLVHGDFGKRNLLVRRVAGKWMVVAVLDWEFAVSGASLIDVGHFLRYERSLRPVVEPHFSAGYLTAGGSLPENWRQLARIFDIAALSESLTHDHLPDTVVSELAELVHAIVQLLSHEPL
jgi:aminoglycoside phosphotransferase (APT) family kinase protein